MRSVVKIALLSLLLSTISVIPAAAAAPDEPLERYIVVLEDRLNRFGPVNQATMAEDLTGGRVGLTFRHALNGFLIEMPEASLPALRNMPGVAYVEPDVEVHLAAQTESTGYDRIDADLNPSGSDYSGVDIAIIDTGVWWDTAAGVSHEDLRLVWVTDCTGAIFYPLFGGCTGGGVDGHGHGTHVAGIAAACDNDIGTRGVAPCATLWSYKALDDNGSGFLGSILAAVDSVAANADQIDVANMSLGFSGTSQALTDAIDAAVAAGVVFVVAAGNENQDASNASPANVDSAITVSAISDYDGMPGGLANPTCYTDTDDELANYSNYGSKVDIAAPGTCILSTHLNDGYATFTGTSMASPTVAGAVARYIADQGIDPANASDVAAVRNALVNGGMPQSGPCGFNGDKDTFAEPLLFMNGTAFGGDGSCDGTPPLNTPPTAVIDSADCVDLDCSFDGSSSNDSDGTVDAHDWDFGDGNTASGATVNHTYATAGTYTVTLTVTDDDNATDSTTTTVTVTEQQGDIEMTAAVPGIEEDGIWATVQFYVTTLQFDFVADAEVVGEWTYLNRRGRVRTKTVIATSDASGLVTFQKKFPNGGRALEFCILDITKPGYVYVESFMPCGVPLAPE